MPQRIIRTVLGLVAALLLSGCGIRTMDQLYAVPKRSQEYQQLQLAIDNAMSGMEYASPLSGENRQTVQMADLDADGREEYLLFARDNSDNPLKIFIFSCIEEDYLLREVIESRGSGFDVVEYADVDGLPGKELVVGRLVSDRVLRYLAVYSFSSGSSRQLMAANYSKFVTADLNEDALADILVIYPGAQEEETALAALYSCSGGSMVRSQEARLSRGSDDIKRIMVSTLHGALPAVYVASSVEESAIITDVFAMKDGVLSNVSLSSESGTSIRTLRNHYVYAVDIDGDGTLELPGLLDMKQVQNDQQDATQHLIRWYAMTQEGTAVDKVYTFHNFDAGWYMTLDGDWAPRVSVTQSDDVYTFYVWDEAFQKAEKLLTVFSLTGADRELEAQLDGRIALYKTDGVIYAAKLEVGALSRGLLENDVCDSFHLIHMDWKTGET